jgi:hypothetical protein
MSETFDAKIAFHKDVPANLQGKPFAELAWFLYNQLDGIPPGDLEPEMLSKWIEEHAEWSKTNHQFRLTYQFAPNKEERPLFFTTQSLLMISTMTNEPTGNKE